MSRIGKKPIPIPKGVTVKVATDAVEVQGPKGKLRQLLPPGIVFSQEDGTSSPGSSATTTSCGSSTAWRGAWLPTP